MKRLKFKPIWILLSCIIITIHITDIDTNDLSIMNNLGAYCGIIAMMCFIFLSVIKIRKEAKNDKRQNVPLNNSKNITKP